MKIAGRVALVTGGASGLGRATAAALHQQGAHVVVADLDPSGAPDGVVVVPTDVTDPESVTAAVDEACSRFGALHITVSCAGVHQPTKLLGQGQEPLRAFDTTLRVNTTGTFNVLRAAALTMRRNELEDEERGVIINTASVAAWEGQVGHVAYGASKAAVLGMTLPAARELAPHQIRVNAIAPGIFATDMVANVSAEEVLARPVQHPKRLGQPEEFAALVTSIVTNPYLNAETIRLDGGARLPATL